MTDEQLKRLADQCMCHPASIDTIEQGGEAIVYLMKQRDELLAALEELNGVSERCYMHDHSACVKARAAIASAKGGAA